MYFTNFQGLPRVKREDGVWTASRTLQEMLYYQSKEIHDTLFALVSPPTMRAITRLRDETPPDMPAEQLFARLWELQKEELESTGAAWPAKLKLEHVAAAGTSWHIFPNTIVLPAPDGVLWYRMRPYGDDPHRCIFDIWGLQRYAPGKEPRVQTHVTEGFEAFRGRNPFLEQDFDNMYAVDRGMSSRGWIGARTNPSEEAKWQGVRPALFRLMCAAARAMAVASIHRTARLTSKDRAPSPSTRAFAGSSARRRFRCGLHVASSTLANDSARSKRFRAARGRR